MPFRTKILAAVSIAAVGALVLAGVTAASAETPTPPNTATSSAADVPLVYSNTVVLHPPTDGAPVQMIIATHPTDGSAPMAATVTPRTAAGVRISLGVMNAGTVTVDRVDGNRASGVVLAVDGGQLHYGKNMQTPEWRLTGIGGGDCASMTPGLMRRACASVVIGITPVAQGVATG